MPSFGNPQLKLLEKLCNVIAISGDEGEVRKIVMDEIKPYADEVKVDALGNVLATRLGRTRSGKRTRVMLDAHMDEVGFMLVADDGEGIYHFERKASWRTWGTWSTSPPGCRACGTCPWPA